MSLLCFLLTTVNKLNPEGVCLETPSLPKHISKMGNLRLTNKQTKLNCVIWIWSLTRDLFCKCDSYALQIQIGADECLSSNNLLSRVLSLSTWWQGWKFWKTGKENIANDRYPGDENTREDTQTSSSLWGLSCKAENGLFPFGLQEKNQDWGGWSRTAKIADWCSVGHIHLPEDILCG